MCNKLLSLLPMFSGSGRLTIAVYVDICVFVHTYLHTYIHTYINSYIIVVLEVLEVIVV